MGLDEDRLARMHDAVQRHLGTRDYFTPATYTPKGGTPIDLRGYYVRRVREVIIDEEVISSLEHKFEVLEVDLPEEARRGASLLIRGETHEVKGVEGPDDSGWVRLLLKLPD